MQTVIREAEKNIVHSERDPTRILFEQQLQQAECIFMPPRKGASHSEP